MGDTNTGFGDLRATDSVVEPSSPVENCSFTPRWPITTRSATRAWSQISLATMPVASVVSQGTPRLAQRLAHLGREVEVGLEAERAGDVVQEGALDRDHVDDVQADNRGAHALGQPEGVLEGGVRVLGAVERDQDCLDHGGTPWPPLTLARARVQGRPLQTVGGPLRRRPP